MVEEDSISPLRLIIIMMLAIFVAEAFVMAVFYLFGESPSLLYGFLDAGLLSLLVIPPMYYLIFRPMRRQHRQLHHSQRWLQTITENLPEALVSTDGENTVLSFNPAAERIFGYAAGEIIGQSASLLMAGEAAKHHGAYIRRYLQSGESRIMGQTREVEGKRRDGSLFPAEIQVREIVLDDQVYFVAMMRDITRQKMEQQRREQMQESIERAQRLESLGVLAGGIAHDFNNIIAAIMGNAELLGISIREGGDDIDECLDNIGKGCNHAADLCRQMLAYAGRGKYVLENVNVSVMLAEMEKLMRVSIPRSIEIEKHLQTDPPVIHADRTQMEQVILNLLTNAAEAIGDKEGGRIGIDCRKVDLTTADVAKIEHGEGLHPGPYVRIEVKDNGCGIQPEDLPRLFEPFFTTKFTGRGLGMSAVLGILRSHRGGISIDSVPGEGTTMRVFFPTLDNYPAKVKSPETVETVGNWRGVGTVLVVDDEFQLRCMACKMLTHMGFNTLTAENGEQCLDIAGDQRQRLAAVLLDLTMPVMGGEQAYLELRRRYPELPVLIASGFGESTLEEVFGDRAPDAFVSKPFHYTDLQRAMKATSRVPPEMPPRK
ncbi:MAG TPA: PAS domain S-box protein [Mariprofundaceae bacterium]|nr:PAS domain S-box protein [Mariprofundaceae bacterium]